MRLIARYLFIAFTAVLPARAFCALILPITLAREYAVDVGWRAYYDGRRDESVQTLLSLAGADEQGAAFRLAVAQSIVESRGIAGGEAAAAFCCELAHALRTQSITWLGTLGVVAAEDAVIQGRDAAAPPDSNDAVEAEFGYLRGASALAYWQIQAAKKEDPAERKDYLRAIVTGAVNGKRNVSAVFWAADELVNMGAADVLPDVIRAYEEHAPSIEREDLIWAAQVRVRLHAANESRLQALAAGLNAPDHTMSGLLRKRAIEELARTASPEAIDMLIAYAA